MLYHFWVIGAGVLAIWIVRGIDDRQRRTSLLAGVGM
jgi:hypothetical protein